MCTTYTSFNQTHGVPQSNKSAICTFYNNYKTIMWQVAASSLFIMTEQYVQIDWEVTVDN